MFERSTRHSTEGTSGAQLELEEEDEEEAS